MLYVMVWVLRYFSRGSNSEKSQLVVLKENMQMTISQKLEKFRGSSYWELKFIIIIWCEVYLTFRQLNELT